MEEYSTKQLRRDKAWLHAALVFALTMSKDPGRKVGAVVVAPGNRLCSFGYNGLITGMPETEENWSRPRKYDLVRHAEKNALFCAPFDTRGCTLYSTLKPCHDCLGDAVNCGITDVVYLIDHTPYIGARDDLFYEFACTLNSLREVEPDEQCLAIRLAYHVEHDGYREI